MDKKHLGEQNAICWKIKKQQYTYIQEFSLFFFFHIESAQGQVTLPVLNKVNYYFGLYQQSYKQVFYNPLTEYAPH